MAVEVDTQQYRFKNSDLLGSQLASQFHYNALHDLESLWWIVVYFIFNKDIEDQRGVPASIAQQSYAAQLFYSNRDARIESIEVAGRILEKSKILPPAVRPIAELLEDLRIDLTTAYHALENTATPNSDIARAKGLHERFNDIFCRIASSAKIKHLTVRPFRQEYGIPIPIIGKRRRSEDIPKAKGPIMAVGEYAVPGTKADEPIPTKRAKIVHVRTRPALPRKAKQKICGE